MTVKRVASEPPVSPWLTVQQVATYADYHPDTIYDAVHEWESTRGRRGLRGHQRAAGCKWKIHKDDVDAWVRSEKPASRRLGRAS